MEQDLKIIKKKYGENMSKLCREFFPTLLEEEGLLPELLINHFEPNHSLYQDLIDQEIEIEFKNYIYSLVNVENNNEIKTNKTPKELLSEAGYDLYECKTEKEIQQFKKYYTKEEELCTFKGKRLDKCRVFFAVKKDADKINRVDYPNPKRQDEYGTSVISIQFMRDPTHTLSIKNRYNHSVNNPDSTFSNNLDNIIDGLTESFEREYGLIQKHKNNGLEIENYVRASDGKYYKYNHEIDNIYYCPNNIIIDNYEVKRYEKEKYIIIDYFIVDLVNKKIKVYDERIKDPFLDTVDDIEKIEIEKKRLDKKLVIKINNKEDIKLVLNKNNEIIRLENTNVEKIKNDFLYDNTSLQEIDLPNLQEVGKGFLCSNIALEKANLPKLKEAGKDFLYCNRSMRELNLPSIQKVGNNFFGNNSYLQVINLPNLQKVDDRFLFTNEYLQKLYLPNLKEAGKYFLCFNKELQELNCPKLEKVGSNFLFYNRTLQKINCPNLDKVGYNFLCNHPIINERNFNNNMRISIKRVLMKVI